MLRVLAAFAALICFSTLSFAQEEDPARKILVGIHESPPFVMIEGDEVSGMAVDLWEYIAGEIGVEYDYLPFETVGQLVDAVAAENVDLAVTNLTITEKRAARFDFTQPWFDAGLRIMASETPRVGFWGVVAGLRDAGYLKAYAWLAFIIVVSTIGMTLFDRKFDTGFPREWTEGIAESFYSVMSVVTSGKAPKRKNLFGWVGRIWQALWLVCGIAVMAYVTSSVTSVMTSLTLTGTINDVSDLAGRTVAVSEGSSAEEFAHDSIITSISTRNLRASVEALENGWVEAIIGDAPVLEYYLYRNPQAGLKVVGPIFQPEKYGFGLPHGSSLRRAMTIEVVGAHEEGVINDLRKEYFGDN
ncbi:transporter substrate-binding domain-containing protein [Labrenzia sp. 011]|uniref:transporter substrate-binding domain-containing protein n=1 Tax=Labrenzia sp. 011 TaxID=2171494 RepID=UPI000D52134E|nr:transporter substrate-binding domain-containing protein [Labrenzia sp. 011]PVB60474.1 ABC transporter substrate-binding protein [Labrenzia sp. 011]